MAQILKEDIRLAIINSAKTEFLENGYKGASMRNIAKKANITVGNLYRYFKSKEDINLYIVVPTYKKISAAIKALSLNNISVETRVFNVKPNLNELKKSLDVLSEQLVNIYENNKLEFNILMIHSKLSEDIINCFNEIIGNLISQSFIFDELNEDKKILSKAYAESVFAGIKNIFKENELDSNDLKNILKRYLKSFLLMLDSDLGKLGE